MNKLHSTAVPMGEKRSRYTLTAQYGGVGYTDSREVRAHLIELVEVFGLPARSVARVVGMHEESVVMILRGRNPSVRTRHALALKQVTHQPTPEQGRVLSIGAARRLQALGALGHTVDHIAEHTHLGVHMLRRVAAGKTTTILYDDWSEIVRVYDQLSATAGTSDIARKRAVKRQNPPPLDWEGHDIDDPRVTVKLSGVETRNGTAELAEWRREKVAGLTRVGFSAEEIAVRVGVSKRQVVRDRQVTGVRGGEWDDDTAA